MKAEMKLGDRVVGRGAEPYLIAEIGVNHEGDFDLACKLIDLAREGGADAAKFQTYKAAKLASADSPAYWDTTKEPTESQFKLFQKYDQFEAEDYVALAAYCRRSGIDFVSTPFDSEAVDLLDPLVPFFKIASADITNVPLLRQVGGKKKPVVLSTGAATLAEIDGAVAERDGAGCLDIALLHCVLNYPCPNQNAHLNMIEDLQRLTGYMVEVGNFRMPSACSQAVSESPPLRAEPPARVGGGTGLQRPARRSALILEVAPRPARPRVRWSATRASTITHDTRRRERMPRTPSARTLRSHWLG